MNEKQAKDYIRHCGGSTKEISNIAAIMEIGSKIERALLPGAKLFEAMDAYSLTPKGKMLARAASASD